MSIEFELSGGIAVITINRPEKANALDADHYRALSDAWERVRDDDEIRAAIITGAGDRVFSAGADLKSWVGREKTLSDHWLTQKDMLLNRGMEIWKPVISAINGACVGGGMTLMLATDIRVAVSHATFAVSEVRRGLIAANGGTQRIMKQLPYAVAMEMLLLGNEIDAQTALSRGLVNRVVERNELIPTARRLAEQICRNAPLAVRAAKELAIRSLDLSVADGLRMEQYVNLTLHASEDTGIAKQAFADKREPQFIGK